MSIQLKAYECAHCSHPIFCWADCQRPRHLCDKWTDIDACEQRAGRPRPERINSKEES